MEIITMWRGSIKYRFKAGESFPVKRNINGECVIIRGETEPNLVWTEEMAKSYGRLEETAELSTS